MKKGSMIIIGLGLYILVLAACGTTSPGEVSQKPPEQVVKGPLATLPEDTTHPR
jgi:hypothetical protein